MSDTNQSPIDPLSARREDPKVIHPDSIIIDHSIDHHHGDQIQQETNKYNAENLAGSKGPIILRLICLVSSLCCFVVALGALIGSVILGLGSLIFLFRNRALNQSLFGYIKFLIGTLVATLGFLVGVISPVVGFTIVIFYFSMTDSDFLRSILSQAMKQ